MKISNIKTNCLGTLSLDGKFNGMRKAQDFIVYPMQKDDDIDRVKIQSDTRIGYISLKSGDVIMSPSRQGGSYFVHLAFAQKIDQLTQEELAGLKYRLFQTAGEKVGNNGMKIYCDNSNADKVVIFNNQ
jgi:hypothetical protein